MDDKAAYWASVVLSAVALLLLVTNVALVNSNRALQNEVGQRQAAISKAIDLSNLNNNLANALADMAMKNDDKDIRDLLAQQGITIKPKADAAAAKKK